MFDDDDDESVGRSDQHVTTVPLEHSFGGGKFEARGSLTYTGPKLVTSKSKRLVSVQIEQTKFSSDDLSKLQILINEDRPYRIRIQSDVNDAKSVKVVASIPSCLLAAADFHEIVRLHVDQYGHIRGMWYQTMATECPSTKSRLPSGPVQLVTSVSVDMEGKGGKVLTEPVPKIERETEQRQKEQQGPASFFQKYWYYIIGGVLLVSLLSGEEPKQAAAAAGGGGGGGRQ